MAVKVAAWTFMVYLAGDNNLAAAGEADLGEMRKVGSSDDVNVVAQFDNAASGGSKRFHLQKGGAGESVQDLGPTDSGDPGVLLDFVDWAVGKFPAQQYALVLWNHGGGWAPACTLGLALWPLDLPPQDVVAEIEQPDVGSVEGARHGRRCGGQVRAE